MTESIGQQLRKRRETRRLSLEEAAQSTRIRLRYLQALEADDFDLLPSQVQRRGFLRSYAQWLEMPADSMLAQLEGKQPESPASPELEQDQRLPEQAAASLTPGTSQFIFQEIGNQLRRQRELLGLTREEIERNTHLRLRYLKALESGHLEDLPSPVQGKGMLSNYAAFLGMDADALLLRFAEGLQARLADRKEATQPRGSGRTVAPVRKQSALRRRFLAPDFIIGFFTVIVLVGFVIWAVMRVSQVQEGQEPEVTPPSVADVLAQATATASLTPTGLENAIEGTPASVEELVVADGTSEITATLALLVEEVVLVEESTPTFPVGGSGVIQLYVIARQRAWVRVIVDGEVELEGRIAPGSPYLFTGDERIELLTGNGAALQVFLNRQDLGPLGISGEVVQRVFILDGMQTPTPAVSPTSRPTETSTGTRLPEGTPSATSTPRDLIP